jgi:hypothetical protein
VETLVLPDGRAVAIPKAQPQFRAWRGEVPGDTYGGKAVVDAGGEPAFAELAILRLFETDGWEGVWIDTYRNKYRRGYWGVEPILSLPTGPAELLHRIHDARGTGRSGTWDLCCWKDDSVLFAESKRARKDAIRSSQVTWLAAAIALGLPLEAFLVVEWTLSG